MTRSLYTEEFNLQHFKLHYFKHVLHFYSHYNVVKKKSIETAFFLVDKSEKEYFGIK